MPWLRGQEGSFLKTVKEVMTEQPVPVTLLDNIYEAAKLLHEISQQQQLH